MISSVNHHVSIVHLRIPLKYLNYVAQRPTYYGIDSGFSDWYRLEIQRSKWYDLFNAHHRLEAMRAIWGITGYLMRQDVSGDNLALMAMD